MKRSSLHILFHLGLSFAIFACSPSKKLNGGVATGTQKKTETEAPAVTPPTVTPPVVQTPVVQTPVEEPPKEPEVFVPDDVVDGQEVIKDCKVCMDRATTLAASIGFTADKRLTFNLGFYKIDPSKNLCDIHFKKNLFDQIQDHEGKDSILDGQIALYCPCDCDWAVKY